FSLEDGTGSVAAVCFSIERKDKETGKPKVSGLAEGAIVRVFGNFTIGDGRRQIIVEEAQAIVSPAPEDTEAGAAAVLTLSVSEADGAHGEELRRLFARFPGNVSVTVLVRDADGRLRGRGILPLPIDAANPELRAGVRAIFGRDAFLGM
ncbi:MAG: hypothetical protein IKF96_04330, partial [Eggerthellaceae bacterium]|nr:hypothetical protein [Eggerthellaceae bacterium]